MHFLKKIPSFSFLLCLLLMSCSSEEGSSTNKRLNVIAKPEAVGRKQSDTRFALNSPKLVPNETYPWETEMHSPYPKITKDYFRCNGTTMNPVKTVQENKKEVTRFYDCGGCSRHSLPLRDNKEFVYPILIDVLNYIQDKTGKRVVITSGHRCPDHNVYVDASAENRSSKHMIGAEVAFYVQGLEDRPEDVVNIVMNYYQDHSKYQGQAAYQEFVRYDTAKTNVTEQPWYNKEIFIKAFQKSEGRNFDNRHPYPYLSLQVRFDWDKQEKVMFSWDAAQKNLLRW